MTKRNVIMALAALLIISSPFLLRKRTIPLVSSGRVVAVAKRPWVMPWNDNNFSISAHGSELFSMWGDIFHFPLFVHPFSDGQRFLCIYDDDTAMLVFVVDYNNYSFQPPEWPHDDYLRKHLAERATNVVLVTKGFVRLPSYAELQEVSFNLEKLTQKEFRAASFPSADLGVWKFYFPKDSLLNDLDTNRYSAWP